MREKQGWIEVIFGPMFSGKTEELIRRLKRAEIAKQKIQAFKPSRDNRYSVQTVTSHNGISWDAIAVEEPGDILASVLNGTDVVAIDETQFFNETIVDICDELAREGKRIIVAGLDLDFRREPFGQMPLLIGRADEVQKLTAICMVCGRNAIFTQRLIEGEPAAIDDPIILVGAKDYYEARCRDCHAVAPSKAMKNQMSLALSEGESVSDVSSSSVCEVQFISPGLPED